MRESELRELIREFLVREINETYVNYIEKLTIIIDEKGNIIVKPDFEERVRRVVQGEWIPYILWKEGKVIFTRSFKEKLTKAIEYIGEMKDIAKLLGWECKENKVIITSYESLLEFLREER